MSVELNIYYAKWCGFCKPFHSEENRKKIIDRAGGYKNLKVNIIEEQNINRDDISGFPTIKVKVNNIESDYQGDRDIDSIYNHIDNIYNNLSNMVGGKYNHDCGCGNEVGVDMVGGHKNLYHKKYLKYKIKYLNIRKN